jgi:pimeloyl-ACP methyl ester carboxylesterase
LADAAQIPEADLTVDSVGIRLAVRDYGGEGGAPLLLLHGSGKTLAAWDEVAPLLTTAFRVVAYDAPAHGRSETPRGQPQFRLFLDAVDDVAAAVGLQRPILVGHSMGGGTALLYAAKRRGCRGAVSADAAYVREASDPLPTHAGEEEIRAAGFGWTGSIEELERKSEAIVAGAARASFRRAHVRRADGLFERRPSAAFVLAFTRLATTLERQMSTQDLYAAIDCPVLLVCGESGWAQGKPLTPELRRGVERLPARFPQIELAWVDCGHMIPWERPRELAALITAFAERCE